MKRFKNILVVFDSKTDNQALLYHAVDLAQRNQASLKVVDVIEEAPSILAKPVLRKTIGEVQAPEIHIIEELPSVTPLPPSSKSPDEGGMGTATEELSIAVQEFIIQEEQRSIQQFVTAIRQAGILVKSKTLYGIPFIEITREVLRSQHDLVMITAEGNDSLKGTWFGSATLHLMRKCPCPVWVIKPGQNRQFGRILAAVDLDQDDEVRIALNRKIIELATSLARMKAVELIVMGTVSRSGIAGLLIGNTAEKVLRQVDSSVLAIKPEGFVTPVKLDTM